MFKQKQRGIYSEYLVKNPQIIKIIDEDEDMLKGPTESLFANPQILKKNTSDQFPIENFGELMDMVNDHLKNFQEEQDQIKRKIEGQKIYTEIEPKVMESYKPIPGRVPRKVDIERKRLSYNNVNIKAEMDKRKISQLLLESQEDKKINWMSLDVFDDVTLDDYSCQEWLEKARNSVCLQVQKEMQENIRDQNIRKNTIMLMRSKSKNFGATRSKILDFNDENDNDKPNIKGQKTLSFDNLMENHEKKTLMQKQQLNDKKIAEEQEKYYKELMACNVCDQCVSIKVQVDAIWMRNKVFDIKKVILTDYDSVKKKWTGYWQETNMSDRFSRIQFCFQAENTIKWLDRVEKALYLRNQMNIKLKYQFLIEKMKVDDLLEIDSEQIHQIKKYSLSLNKIKDMDIDVIIDEVKQDYKRTVNSIIFNKNILLLKLPFEISDIKNFKQQKDEEEEQERINQLFQQKQGLIKLINNRDAFVLNKSGKHFQYLKKQNFNEMFKEFCFSSLFIKKESILALQDITKCCQQLNQMSFFSLKGDKRGVKRLDEFKTIQESSISSMIKFLKVNWINSLIQIIKDHFKDIGKGWFNMNETNRLTYEFGKLKRFLTVVRLMMQDSLKQLLKNSLQDFFNFFKSNLPKKVKIISDYQVDNIFEGEKKGAILQIDMIQVANKNEFNYLSKTDKIKVDIVQLIEKVTEELQKIPDLEPKVLDKLHKAKKNESFVLTPILPKEQPQIPNPKTIPKRYPDENLWLWELHDQFKEMIDKPLIKIEKYRNVFAKHEKILNMKPEEIIENLKSDQGTDIGMIKKELKKWQGEEEKLKTIIQEEIQVSIFSVNCKEAIRILQGKYQEINKKLIEMLNRKIKETTNSIQKKLQEIEKQLIKEPSEIEELSKIQDFITNELPVQLQEIREENNVLKEIFELLENQNYKLPKDQLNKRWQLIKGPKEILEIVKQKEKVLDQLLKRFEEKLVTDKEEFKQQISNMHMIIESFHQENKIQNHEEMKENVENFQLSLKQMQSTGKKYNQQEMIFGANNLTDYHIIGEMNKKFQNYYNIWTIVHDWMSNHQKWMNDPWVEVDAVRAEKFVDESFKLFNASLKQIKGFQTNSQMPGSFDILISSIEEIKKVIEEFRVKVPLLVGLKREGMQERHWEEVIERTGIAIKVSDTMTFSELISIGLQKHSQVCIEVGEKASREKNIKNALTVMQDKWEAIEFQLQLFKETNTYVVINFEEIENYLDQHLSDTQTLLVNPFKKPYADEIDKWFEDMLTISNVIEEWQRFQNQWCYLQPIFDSPDINRQLPKETALFKRVDAIWRTTLGEAKVQRRVFKVCTNEGSLDKFKDGNFTFEKIQQELKSYLEVKRSKFGRFYFLSNDDLLSILSQTKEVEKVQDHLRKVFENIASLEFNEEKHILSMSSVEKEKVPFCRVVDPNMKQVEDWMKDVEETMQDSVREKLLLSIDAYKKFERNQWILHHTGQSVLNGSQVHWTKETEEAIIGGHVGEYLESLNSQLKKLVTIERDSLSMNHFITIEALIVIDVHAKDVVQKLHEQEVDSIQGFEWISQLRYYWENKNCQVKCLQTVFPYGYEYLGNSARLVITPLTDKCYMTLMGALRLNLGGAPAGPAGTGKTESTKDLAKALAKQCVVFNCQESMGYQFVAKFFKGLASSGAWCCFDEFNRINLEVLSVIAQQLQVLFNAKAVKKTQLCFEGSEIMIKPTFSVFITMNPGYAGRTELPDNLKALFRPVAMMVPNYALIAEIKLYSFGFIEARSLAEKMVATFRLSSEQLSSQHHYDYGMRAVTSVINAAGFIKKREKKDTPEDIILLKALQDVNLPKFLQDDLPLFRNIIKDLFTETSEPVYDHQQLHEAIKTSCLQMKLQNEPSFTSKVLQLYDTTLVRHGLMLIGPTGAGKSSCSKILQSSLNKLSLINPQKFQKTNIEYINPKSITLPQLYGEYKEMNWQEGIIEIIFEKAIKNQFDEKTGNEGYWIMFDGPVDAVWIESMNTVLDDNKKLCLSSGKVLMLSSQMVMMFEVEDLSEASPATVSRCGMVYMEPQSLGKTILLDNYLEFLSVQFDQGFKNTFRELAVVLVIEGMEFQRKHCKEVIQTTDNNLVSSFLKLFQCLLKNNESYVLSKILVENEPDMEEKLANLIFFTSLWSVGVTVDYQGRKNMESHYKEVIEKHSILRSKLRIRENFYDFCFDLETHKWTPWLTESKPLEIAPNTKLNQVSVPTKDSIRMIEMMNILVSNKQNVLTPGETGTGKSTNAIHFMLHKLKDVFNSTSLVLSAQTKPAMIEETVLNQIAKRKRGIYGASSGKKLLLFIDDLNMPKKETYGAQPPIELLRQYLDYNSWYIWSLNKEYIKIEDLVLLCAMGPPGGSRAFLTNRILRHFNILAYTSLDRQLISDIFTSLLKAFMVKFSPDVKELQEQIVLTSQKLFENIQQELLPIPGKSHYQFNLRDLSRVFAGISSASSKFITTKVNFVKLWIHESRRVFQDRLINETDRGYFDRQIDQLVGELGFGIEEVLNQDKLIITDFHLESIEREYCIVQNLEQFQNKLYEFQDNYNAEQLNGGQKMNLVLFLDACEHISRICRVLKQPQGHALLLGVGGSGKQSLSKLATFIQEYQLFQIQIIKGYNTQKWREDIKDLIYQAVFENKEITFLFNDQQIKQEEMLEDVNQLLNTGTLLQLPFNSEEQKNIADVTKADCQKLGIVPNKINLFQMFVERVKKNTHILLCMSPLGEAFWNRLRMFPALINCCTINWFQEWPEEALIGVASGNLGEFEEDYQFRCDQDKFVDFFKFAHKHMEGQCKEFFLSLKRIYYVTPTSFLQLIKNFKQILVIKSDENAKAVERLKNGILRLEEANKNVEKLQIELSMEKPQLQKTEEEVHKMLEQVLEDKKIADEKKQKVEEEEQEAQKEKKIAEQIAADVQQEVSEVEKNLQETLKEMDKLNAGHINEINSFPKPPDKVKYVFMATCILMLDPSDIVLKNSWTDEEVEEYFLKLGKTKLFKESNFLSRLKGIDFEKVEEHKIKRIEKMILKHPKRGKEWVREDMKGSNLANFCIYLVVDAAFKYNELFKRTEPLRRKHQEVLEELSLKQKELDSKNKDLRQIEEKLISLENLLNEKETELKNLKDRIQLCTDKLERAKKLTDLLSEENERWNQEIKILEQRTNEIEGNSALAAAMLSYSGPFTNKFRQDMELEFYKYLVKLQVPITENIRMIKFLGNELEIQKWNLAGLPNDQTSIENGIIIKNSSKSPFLIDPEKQALKFLRNMAKENISGVEYNKQKNQNFMKVLEICLQSGKWLIVEDCMETLDHSLEPVLQQNVTKIGEQLSIQIGDKVIPYSGDFKLFLNTGLHNPKFLPETCAKVTIINFSITPLGLIEQMLATIVILENRKLEDQKNLIVKKNSEDKQTLVSLEDRILKTLSESDQNSFLESEELINQLAECKKTSSMIKQRVIDSKIFEKKIDEAREDYRNLARKVASLYFTINDLSKIESMYQYSLQWYENLFKQGVELTPMSNVLEERLLLLQQHFIYLLYCNVSRSLFSNHTMIFSFLLCLNVLQLDDKLDPNDANLLYEMPDGDSNIPENPTDYIAENIWPFIYRKIHHLSQIPDFSFFEKIFLTIPDAFKHFYLSQNLSDDLPESLNEVFTKNPFYYILFVKTLRSDKLLIAIQDYISKTIGQKFVEVPNAGLKDIYEDSTCKTPLIILLSAGSDPKTDFDNLAREKEITNVMSISLGQGQGAYAERMITQAIKSGGWILLQNCHLAQSWMENLELQCSKISQEYVHPEFRLWLTTNPVSTFPVSVLQNSVRITMEPPQGVRATLIKFYSAFQEETFNSKSNTHKKLLYGLCFFHAVVQNRKRFGPLGWNIPYQFTDEDLQVCQSQLESYLEEYKQIPYKVLNFVCAEINYGGRVTDDKDLRLIKSLIEVFINPNVLKDSCKFSPSGKYVSLPSHDLADYLETIRGFPLNADPEIFGLHENAEITTNENQTIEFLEQVTNIKSTSGNNQGSADEKAIQNIIEIIENQLPEPFDFEKVKQLYKPDYSESMNTVLIQEVARYNKLLIIMKSNIEQLKKAIQGIQVMSADMEEIVNSLKLSMIPNQWQYPIGYLSLKPLNSWIQDLRKRVDFFQLWITNGKPEVFWFSGFFFPQAFITGTLQNYARKNTIPIDQIAFKYNILDMVNTNNIRAPSVGVIIDGLYLEGAKWDYSTHQLTDSKPKELFSSIPYIHLLPVKVNEQQQKGFYTCPLYKISSRSGQLSTTGHSTNFVMNIELPTDSKTDYWIMRGVAALLQLRY